MTEVPKDFRFPDKPIQSTLDFIGQLNGPKWLVQAKLDGWRIEAYVNEEVTIYTRHARLLAAALRRPVSSTILEELQELRLNGLTIFDGEYIGRRQVKKPAVGLFDIIKLEGKWITHWPYEERLETLRDLVKARLSGSQTVFIPASVETNFEQFIEKLKSQAEKNAIEGIVAKTKKSQLIASRGQSAKNPAWLKARWSHSILSKLDIPC